MVCMGNKRKKRISPILNKRLEQIVDHPIGGPTFFNIANCLTFFRIFISPVFLFVYLQYETLGITAKTLPYVLFCLLAVSELSDALDGYLARKYNQVTDLGKILDPMADSIARISVFLTFTQPPVNVPLLCVFIFLYRDSVISTLRTICALRGVALAARTTGKMKAIIQAMSCFAITLLLIPHSLGYITTKTLSLTSMFIVLLSGIYALYSGAEYIIANRHHIQKVLMRGRVKRARRLREDG